MLLGLKVGSGKRIPTQFQALAEDVEVNFTAICKGRSGIVVKILPLNKK